MEKQQLMEAYQFRHACKEFDPARQIPAEDFEFILEAARLSPSSYGFEPWKFVVLQNKTLRSKLLPISWGAQKQLPTASHFVLVLARNPVSMAPDSDYIQYIMNEVKQLPPVVVEKMGELYQRFLDSDFKLSGNERAMFEWASRQAYIALGNMMTGAAMIGIDSCPMEGFDKEKAEEILRQEGILKGEEFGLACMVAFGYRIEEPRPKTRRPMDRVTEWVR